MKFGCPPAELRRTSKSGIDNCTDWNGGTARGFDETWNGSDGAKCAVGSISKRCYTRPARGNPRRHEPDDRWKDPGGDAHTKNAERRRAGHDHGEPRGRHRRERRSDAQQARQYEAERAKAL